MSTVSSTSPSRLTQAVEDILIVQPSFNAERMRKALSIAEASYKQEEHFTGEPLTEYVAGVLRKLLPFEPDEDTIIACVLHQLLRGNEWSLLDIEQEFGATIRSLISDAHILSFVTMHEKRMTLHDLRLMMLTVSDDMRTIMLTLAKLAYVSTRLPYMDSIDQAQFSKDSLQLFAPVAARLGIYSIKQELESAAFPYLYKADYERIQEQFKDLYKHHGQFLEVAQEQLTQFLQEKMVTSRVKSRQKLPYSVFMKMREKGLTHIESVPDLFAIRVIVPTEADCYQALGLLHQFGTAVPHRFKDYISFPKPNGYQSLHTTLVKVPGAPESLMLEVQIRTESMHREAEYGVAAHWSYKEVGSTEGAMRSVQLNRILAAQETLDDGEHQQFANHIFVLSPTGDILELPEGATPLDFAFLIHSDLGLSFKGARVNGRIVPLQYALENGDIIEIQKNSQPNPSPQWLQVVKTAGARNKLKKFLYAQQRPQLLSAGKKLMNDQLRKRKLPVLDTELSVLAKFDGHTLTLSQREDVLIKVGQGAETSGSVYSRLDTLKEVQSPEELVSEAKKKGAAKSLWIEGGMRMPHRFAKCCKSEESKGAITGLINRHGNVMIHRSTCKMLKSANPTRKLRVKFV